MATFAFIDCRLEVNSVVMSAMATSVTLKVNADELEDTAFGDTYRSRLGGLKDWTVDIDFNADFAAAQVDATLFPLLGTLVTIKLRPTTSAISATNPEYSGSVLITEYTPLDGGVGDLAKTSVSWPGSGTLARATA
jgi:hypothetical protein